MTNSIINESKQARNMRLTGLIKGKKIIIGVILITVASGGYYFFSQSQNQPETWAQVKEWTARRGDIQIGLEASGKVVAEDGVSLSFSVSGDTLEVKNVYVKEGQKITKGDKIATVKTETLELDLRNAYASYQSALSNYNEKLAGPTAEEISKAKSNIEQSELSLEQSKISLEKTKISAAQQIVGAEDVLETAKENLDDNRDIETSEDVSDVYEDLVDEIKSISIALEGVLSDSDKIIGVDDLFINDDFEKLLGVKDAGSLSKAIGSYERAKENKKTLDGLVVALSVNSSQAEIDRTAEQTKAILSTLEDHLYDMQTLLNATITDPNLTQSELDSFKGTINSNRSSINSKITALNADIKAVADVISGLDDYAEAYQDAQDDLKNARVDTDQNIINAEASVKAKELSLKQSQLTYDELVAPLTEAESATARSSLTSASISLQKARNEIDQATLISPIDGEVALLNYKLGDIILKDDTKPMATIINNETLFIEVNIEEADISKIKIGDKAYASFDAVSELELTGEISFISLTSETSNNGIVTYLVRVILNNPTDSPIREGMTTSLKFVTAGVSDVLIVPVAAVRNVGGQPSVQLKNGEWRQIITGFTDGAQVEVLSGLEAGETILY